VENCKKERRDMRTTQNVYKKQISNPIRTLLEKLKRHQIQQKYKLRKPGMQDVKYSNEIA
jgi:hypothetical protein